MATLTLEKGAEDLVVRSRNGDQNAMALINEVRKAAARGNVKAQMGFEAIKTYIEKHPTEETKKHLQKEGTIGAEARQVLKDLRKVTTKTKKSIFGVESPATDSDPKDICIIILALPTVGGERALNAGCVLLANGPHLTDTRIRQIGEAITDPQLRAFFYQNIVNYSPSDDHMPASLNAIAKAGKVVGQARMLQIARLPNTSLSIISPQVGWELGG